MNHLLQRVGAILLGGLALASCNNDETDFTLHNVSNELLSALQEQGYQTVNGQLVLDMKVLNTRSLDFSGKNINNFEGIAHFPLLERIKLDNNNYGDKATDILEQLSQNKQLHVVSLRSCGINRLDVSKNPHIDSLYLDGANTFTNLSGLDTQEGKHLRLLTLPEAAKWNYSDILHFYQTKNTDQEIKVDVNGTLKDYSTHVAVPNAKFRAFLKSMYPEVFTANDEIDLTKQPKVNNSLFGGNTTWTTPDDMMKIYFNAEGMGNLDGYQFFINRCINTWRIINGDFDTFTLANDTMIEHFAIGQTKVEGAYVAETGSWLKKLDVSNCPKLFDLVADGINLDSINVKGDTNLSLLSFGPGVKSLDLSTNSNLMVVHSLCSGKATLYSKLSSITFPTNPKNKGMTMVDLSNTAISYFDCHAFKNDTTYGTTIGLERCKNLRDVKIDIRLGRSSSFRNGYFTSIDLRGATEWNVEEQSWLPAINNENLYKNNPNLETLNGESYSNDEVEGVKMLKADLSNLLAWHYYSFTPEGGVKEVGIDAYPKAVENATDNKDAEWAKRNDWDFALHLGNIRTNSGKSGEGKGGLHYDSSERLTNPSFSDDVEDFIFKEDEKGELNMILSMDKMPPVRTSVSMAQQGTFVRSGMELKPANGLLYVRSADGKHYMAMKPLAIYDSKGEIGHASFKYVVIK